MKKISLFLLTAIVSISMFANVKAVVKPGKQKVVNFGQLQKLVNEKKLYDYLVTIVDVQTIVTGTDYLNLPCDTDDDIYVTEVTVFLETTTTVTLYYVYEYEDEADFWFLVGTSSTTVSSSQMNLIGDCPEPE